MLAVVRIRGEVKTNKEVLDTLRMLGLDRKHTLSLVPDTESMRGMLKKVESHVAWGQANEDIVKRLGEEKVLRLKPPIKGFKGIKQAWPKGDLGYRGDKINDLIKRML